MMAPARNARGRVVAALALVVVSVAGRGTGTAAEPRVKPMGPGTVVVHLRARHSRFSPNRIVVRAGTTVRFEVDNRDPINHELIVGPPEIHALHEAGTEHEHTGGGEASVAPKTVGTTSYRFDAPGTVVFACHLPGHFAYGMSGAVIITT